MGDARGSTMAAAHPPPPPPPLLSLPLLSLPLPSRPAGPVVKGTDNDNSWRQTLPGRKDFVAEWMAMLSDQFGERGVFTRPQLLDRIQNQRRAVRKLLHALNGQMRLYERTGDKTKLTPAAHEAVRCWCRACGVRA